MLAAVFLFQHHQRGVLRQRLGDHRAALHVGADHLVRPPLVRDFVRGDVEHEVDVLGIAQVGDEADRLRVRNGVGEALRKARVTRELEDAHLVVLVRREVRREIVERLLRSFDHAIDVVRMLGVVVDLDRHAVPVAALDLPVGRQVAEERQHRAVHLVMEITPAALGPFALQVARRERDLIGARADRRLEVDPVGIGEAHAAARRFVLQFRLARHVVEPALAALSAIDDLVVLVVTQVREHRNVVEERAVVVEIRAQVAAAGRRRQAVVGEAAYGARRP